MQLKFHCEVCILVQTVVHPSLELFFIFVVVKFLPLPWVSINSLCSDILRTMQKSEDTSIYDKVLNAIFDEEMLSTKHIRQVGRMESVGDNSSSIQHTDFVTEVRDYVVDVNKEIFRHHCAKHLEISPMRLMDDCPQFNRSISSFKFFTILWFSSLWIWQPR